MSSVQGESLTKDLSTIDGDDSADTELKFSRPQDL